MPHVFASSFADKADVAAFKKAKAKGMTDQEAFKFGDNGVGFTGLDCTDEAIPFIALPREDWMERFGSKAKASRQPVMVTINGKTVTCIIGDTMPSRKNIKNGCGIDLAPGAQKAFGLTPPFKVSAEWKWPAICVC